MLSSVVQSGCIATAKTIVNYLHGEDLAKGILKELDKEPSGMRLCYVFSKPFENLVLAPPIPDLQESGTDEYNRDSDKKGRPELPKNFQISVEMRAAIPRVKDLVKDALCQPLLKKFEQAPNSELFSLILALDSTYKDTLLASARKHFLSSTTVSPEFATAYHLFKISQAYDDVLHLVTLPAGPGNCGHSKSYIETKGEALVFLAGISAAFAEKAYPLLQLELLSIVLPTIRAIRQAFPSLPVAWCWASSLGLRKDSRGHLIATAMESQSLSHQAILACFCVRAGWSPDSMEDTSAVSDLATRMGQWGKALESWPDANARKVMKSKIQAALNFEGYQIFFAVPGFSEVLVAQ